MVASGGNGTCVEHEASDGGVYDLPEGVTVGITIGLGPASATYDTWTSEYVNTFVNNQ